MKKMTKYSCFILISVSLWSCSNEISEVNALTRTYSTQKDIGKGIRIIYSDSAAIKVVVTAPVLEKSNDINDPVETFPQGIFITFYDESQNASSWLKAQHAVRNSKKGTLNVKGNVSFYNDRQEKLQTSELIWHEEEQKMETEKFIRITRPADGDTLFGIGFIADQNFKRVEIKRRMQGKINAKNLGLDIE